ncbi:hypothetical protein BC826DRAFT_1190485 [Russula brevipes]|nr:hypothetical protein BC826DRAFT_1190485 [Russula brevipes]
MAPLAPGSSSFSAVFSAPPAFPNTGSASSTTHTMAPLAPGSSSSSAAFSAPPASPNTGSASSTTHAMAPLAPGSSSFSAAFSAPPAAPITGSASSTRLVLVVGRLLCSPRLPQHRLCFKHHTRNGAVSTRLVLVVSRLLCSPRLPQHRLCFEHHPRNGAISTRLVLVLGRLLGSPGSPITGSGHHTRNGAVSTRGASSTTHAMAPLALIRGLAKYTIERQRCARTETGTLMLDLLETLLARHGIQRLRYDGKMRTEARDTVLITFRKVGGPKVILISTKCGGIGLNLTTANRNMDLLWNFAAELQAYDRVLRNADKHTVTLSISGCTRH